MDQDKGKKKQPAVRKYDLNEVEDIWSSLLSDDGSNLDDELFEGESLLYGDTYSDPASEDEQPFDSGDDQLADQEFLSDDSTSGDVLDVTQALDIHDDQSEDDEFYGGDLADDSPENEQMPKEPAQVPPEAEEFSAILMFADGMQQKVALARLFHPQEDTILLVDEETNDELIIPFDQLACIQISGFPAGLSDRQKKFGTREIIETVDGTTHHVIVSSKPDLGGLLCGFTTEDQTGFPISLFPKSNISDRRRNRLLTDILLEKRFISHTLLQQALHEFEQIKGMTVEKIIAQRTRVPLAAIEEALDNAEKNQMLGMQPAEILLISGLVNEEQILDALEYHEHINNMEIDRFLVDKGVVKEMEVYVSLAEMHQIPFVDLRQRKIPKNFHTLLPENMIVKNEIVPLVKKDDTLLVTTHLVDISHLRKAIAKAAGCKQVKHVLSPPSQIRKIIQMVQAQRA